MKARTAPGRPALMLAAACLTLSVVACNARARPAGAPDPRKGTVITAEQIERSGARTVWEALRRLVPSTIFTETPRGEPARIRRRGPSTIELFEDMLIYVDNVRVGDVTVLDDIPARTVERILVLTGIEATTRYGTNAGDGVIEIFTRAH
ncbi:MAG: Plug domain-containing protein [Gemmatimonadetes bacterium]|nr:MAG: Plug domain-containing protein [Gemmatimonadota bacterium]